LADINIQEVPVLATADAACAQDKAGEGDILV
jgi:hypothetical protein